MLSLYLAEFAACGTSLADANSDLRVCLPHLGGECVGRLSRKLQFMGQMGKKLNFGTSKSSRINELTLNSGNPYRLWNVQGFAVF